MQDRLYLGNLDALRDWGHALDFVKAMWMILQYDKADDFVIATGKQRSVRTFCEKAFENLGISLEWVGNGPDERGVVASTKPSSLLEINASAYGHEGLCPGTTLISIDPAYFRPTEVETLLGDAGKAHRELGWRPEISFDEMVRQMIARDLEIAKRDALCRLNGFEVKQSFEAYM